MRYRQSCWLGGFLSQPRNQSRDAGPVTEPRCVASRPCQRRLQCHGRASSAIACAPPGLRLAHDSRGTPEGRTSRAGFVPRCCTSSKKWGSASTVARTRPLVHYGGVRRALAEAVTADGAWNKPLSVARTWARRSRKALTPSAASRLPAVRPSRAHAGVRLPTRSRTGRVPLRLFPGCP